MNRHHTSAALLLAALTVNTGCLTGTTPADAGQTCTADSQCPVNQVCNFAGQCVRSGGCSSNADCQSGQICDISGNCTGGPIDAGSDPCTTFYNVAKVATGLCRIPPPTEPVLESCQQLIGDCTPSDLIALQAVSNCIGALNSCQGGAFYFTNGVACYPRSQFTQGCYQAYQSVLEVYTTQTGFTGP